MFFFVGFVFLLSFLFFLMKFIVLFFCWFCVSFLFFFWYDIYCLVFWLVLCFLFLFCFFKWYLFFVLFVGFVFLFCFFNDIYFFCFVSLILFSFFCCCCFWSVLWNYFGTCHLFSSVLFLISSFILLFFVLIIWRSRLGFQQSNQDHEIVEIERNKVKITQNDQNGRPK